MLTLKTIQGVHHLKQSYGLAEGACFGVTDPSRLRPPMTKSEKAKTEKALGEHIEAVAEVEKRRAQELHSAGLPATLKELNKEDKKKASPKHAAMTAANKRKK
jgi:hypothetical protein